MLVKLIWPAMEMLGSPLNVKLETAQFAGVMVIWAASEPEPELLSVP